MRRNTLLSVTKVLKGAYFLCYYLMCKTSSYSIVNAGNFRPKLSGTIQSSVITGAAIGFYYYQLSQSGMSEPKIGVREITQAMSSGYDSYSSWIKTRSWNTKPAISDDYMDYVVMSSDKVGSWVSWDITRSVKKWYVDSSTNYGLAFDLTDAVYQSHARAEAAVQNHGYCDGFLRL